MNDSAASQKRLVIVGATGMVGGYALRVVGYNSPRSSKFSRCN